MPYIMEFSMEKKNTIKTSSGGYEGVTMNTKVAFAPGELPLRMEKCESLGDVTKALNDQMDTVITHAASVAPLE